MSLRRRARRSSVRPPATAPYHKGGGISPGDATRYLTVSGNTVKIVGNEAFSFFLDGGTGNFSGTFYDFQNKAYSFRGVVLQKQNIGYGLFTGDRATGPVTFDPQL